MKNFYHKKAKENPKAIWSYIKSKSKTMNWRLAC
jgi:hypothetical protein